MTQASTHRTEGARRTRRCAMTLAALFSVALLTPACSTVSSMTDDIWPFGAAQEPVADMAAASMRTYATLVAEANPSAGGAAQLAARDTDGSDTQEADTQEADAEEAEELDPEAEENARRKSREERLTEEIRARQEARAREAAEREAARQLAELPDSDDDDIAVRVLFLPGDTTLSIKAEDDLTLLAEELRGTSASNVRINAYWSSESGESGTARLAALKHGLRVRSFLNQRGVRAANVVLQQVVPAEDQRQVVDVLVGG